MSPVPEMDSAASAAQQFFLGGEVEPVHGRSWIVSVTTADERFSVRQIQPSMPVARLELLHEFLAQPQLSNATALVRSEGSGAKAFDARIWISGSTTGKSILTSKSQTLPFPAPLETEELGAIAHALGGFHESGTNPSLLARAPRFRMKEWLVGVRRAVELDERSLAGEIRRESRARRWLTVMRPLLANAETALEQADYLRDEQLVIAHLDLWGSHIVRSDHGDFAFLDCSSISGAPQIVDIAQLIARNGTWTGDRVELVLNRYAESFEIPPMQRRVLPWLTAVDAIGSCGNLLVRAASERDPLSDNDRRSAYAGADQQLELLNALSTAFMSTTPRGYRHQGSRGSRSKKII